MFEAVNIILAKNKCRKKQYYTPAAAKKALRNHGYRIGCKSWYKCNRHGPNKVYHLTSQKVSNV